MRRKASFLVFSRTKHGAERIGRKLEKLGHEARDVIHGDRSQSQRTSALKKFSDGKSACWSRPTLPRAASTSPHIAHVVNFDLPNGSDDFRASHRAHRPCGREGRCDYLCYAARKGRREEAGARARRSASSGARPTRISPRKSATGRSICNQPIDDISSLLAMETRSWKTEGAEHPHHARQHGSHHPHGSTDAANGRSHAGKQREGRSSGSSASDGRSAGRRKRRRSN